MWIVLGLFVTCMQFDIRSLGWRAHSVIGRLNSESTSDADSDWPGVNQYMIA